MKALRPIISLFLILNSTILISQNYRLINPGRTALFKNQNGNVESVGIDSVKIQTDSILFPIKTIRQIDHDCFTPYGASWIGNKVVSKVNGENVFFNRENDTIIIKSNASLNESWKLYSSDFIQVIATVTNHDTMSFLNQTDSVKTISLQAYDNDMNLKNYVVNDYHFQISKNHGFIQLVGFYLFPDLQPEFIDENQGEYNLMGLSTPNIGVQNLKWRDVFDFKVGDELHIVEETSYWGPDVDDYSMHKDQIYNYIGREDYSDSVVYRYTLTQNTVESKGGIKAYTYSLDTLLVAISENVLFDLHLPGESVVIDYEAYTYSMNVGENISKIDPSAYERIWAPSEQCWSNCSVDGCISSYEYIKGLGGPYYSCRNAFSGGGSSRKLVYYKEEEVTWGTPLDVTGVSEVINQSNIDVFPNVVKQYLTIQVKNVGQQALSFKLYDINGRLVGFNKLNSDISKINTSGFDSGIYFYQVINQQNILRSGKIIIE